MSDGRRAQGRGRAVGVPGPDVLLLRGGLQAAVRRRAGPVRRQVIGSPFLTGRDRYERAMEGWVDNTHADAFTHTVRLTDPDAGVEVSAVCTPPPGYELREARARVMSGSADPGICADFPRL